MSFWREQAHSFSTPDMGFPPLTLTALRWPQYASILEPQRRAGSIGECLYRMADAQDDHHGHDVHFESADAGASLTYPQQAGTIRKNGFLVIKGRPCKVRIYMMTIALLLPACSGSPSPALRGCLAILALL